MSEDLASAVPAEPQDSVQGLAGKPDVAVRVSPVSGPASGHAAISIARWWRAAAATR